MEIVTSRPSQLKGPRSQWPCFCHLLRQPPLLLESLLAFERRLKLGSDDWLAVLALASPLQSQIHTLPAVTLFLGIPNSQVYSFICCINKIETAYIARLLRMQTTSSDTLGITCRIYLLNSGWWIGSTVSFNHQGSKSLSCR